MGEIDSYSQIQTSRNGRVITTAQLNLVDTGLSQRGWFELPEDTYKGNGRIRHERIDVTIGNIANAQVHSYQSRQIREQELSGYGVGELNHFDIYLFRNSNLIGGEACEVINFGDTDNRKTDEIYLGHNETARNKAIDDLIFGRESNLNIENYIPAVKLLSEIYLNHIKEHCGQVPYSKFKMKATFGDE